MRSAGDDDRHLTAWRVCLGVSGELAQRAAPDLFVQLRHLATQRGAPVAPAVHGKVRNCRRGTAGSLEQDARVLVASDALDQLATLAAAARQEPLERPTCPRQAARDERGKNRGGT